MPTQVVSSAVAVCANARTQAQNLGDQLVPTHGFEVVIHCQATQPYWHQFRSDNSHGTRNAKRHWMGQGSDCCVSTRQAVQLVVLSPAKVVSGIRHLGIVVRAYESVTPDEAFKLSSPNNNEAAMPVNITATLNDTLTMSRT